MKVEESMLGDKVRITDVETNLEEQRGVFANGIVKKQIMEKIEIDGEKFLSSLLNQDDVKRGRLFNLKSLLPYINKALNEQGLEFKDGRIRRMSTEE